MNESKNISDYDIILLPYIAEIIASNKLTDDQRELQLRAIFKLRSILKYYANRHYLSKLINAIAEKKGAMILKVTSKTEMKLVLQPDCPRYDGNRFITGKYNVPEEELIAWSEVSLNAGGPLCSYACERYKELFISILPEYADGLK